MTVLPADWDWKNPDYQLIFKQRIDALERIRKEPDRIPLLKLYYRDHPADFIDDWGVTYDPRNVERGLPAVVPFVLFPRQREWVEYTIRKWKSREPGLTEKSRDGGLSWLAIGLSCTLCLFYHGMAIGFGSRKEEYVDKSDEPKSLFWKGRMFMRYLPREFRGDWNMLRDAPHMRINFPNTEASISGEAGDNIGRGDRRAIYFVDEAAHLERPELVDFSLSQTTNCRHDISSVNGRANSFAEKRFSGRIEYFTFHWRSDPRKGDDWYEKQRSELTAVVLAQEVDIDYAASAEGILIPSAWIQAAIDSHIKLGMKLGGSKFASLDVADEGEDTCAFCGAHGIVVEHCIEWTGQGKDIFATVDKAFDLCDDYGYPTLRYDADGLGAGVRGDGRVINDRRMQEKRKAIALEVFRGSSGVVDPDRKAPGTDRTNNDFFLNAKAQSWWALRRRFELTWQAVVNGVSVPHDQLISLSSKIEKLDKLMVELSQPTYDRNGAGKMIIEKTPEGMKSPNLADSLMIRMAVAGHRPIGLNKNSREWLRRQRRPL